jgi:hypothetical protein
VRSESGSGADAIFVDHARGAEAHVVAIEVIGERKRVIGIEPAVIGMASLIGFANAYHIG